MTEAEWLACDDPTPMLEFLRGKVGDRKLRLFAVAVCRRGRSILRSKVTRSALDALEAYADGLIDRRTMEQRRAVWYQRFDYPFPISGTWNSALAQATITGAKVWASEAAANAVAASGMPQKERVQQARFLKEITGNPFRPIAIDPQWLTSDVLALARGIYEDRAFDRMPILGDALQDAGCENADILDHCRDPNGVHVRGCWVVDCVLGLS